MVTANTRNRKKGDSSLSALNARLPALAASSEPIVIVGEPGVGKTYLARRIHALSAYCDNRMEILNFRTLTDRDQRIALLGGGLAGLTSSRRSRLANRTTIILKYIDKASRFVQQTVEAICASGEIETGDSRVPLRARFIFIVSYLDKTGEFAPGLAKILNESPCLTIPPLRERSDEFVLILNELGVTLPDPELVSTINTYHWPGNITELKAYLRTLNGLSYDEALKQSERRELHRMILLVEEGKEFPLMEAVSRIIDGIVARALDRHSDQFSRAASMLGLSEREVRRIWKNSQRNLV